MALCERFDLFEINGATELQRQRGDRFVGVGDAARHDAVEKTELRRDIESPAVQRHPAAQMDADGADFSFRRAALAFDPDARQPFDPACPDAKISANSDENFL